MVIARACGNDRCSGLVECEHTHFFVAESADHKGKEVQQLRLIHSSDDFMNISSNTVRNKAPVEVPFSDGLLGTPALFQILARAHVRARRC